MGKNKKFAKILLEKGYDPNTGLNEDVFIKIANENENDRDMAKRAMKDQTIYSILEERLTKVLNLSCKIGKGKLI